MEKYGPAVGVQNGPGFFGGRRMGGAAIALAETSAAELTFQPDPLGGYHTGRMNQGSVGGASFHCAGTEFVDYFIVHAAFPLTSVYTHQTGFQLEACLPKKIGSMCAFLIPLSSEKTEFNISFGSNLSNRIKLHD